MSFLATLDGLGLEGEDYSDFFCWDEKRRGGLTNTKIQLFPTFTKLKMNGNDLKENK